MNRVVGVVVDGEPLMDIGQPLFSPRPPNPCHVPPCFTLVFEPVAAITGNSGVSSATIPTAIAIHRPSRYIMRSIRPANTFWQPGGSLSMFIHLFASFHLAPASLFHDFRSQSDVRGTLFLCSRSFALIFVLSSLSIFPSRIISFSNINVILCCESIKTRWCAIMNDKETLLFIWIDQIRLRF